MKTAAPNRFDSRGASDSLGVSTGNLNRDLRGTLLRAAAFRSREVVVLTPRSSRFPRCVSDSAPLNAAKEPYPERSLILMGDWCSEELTQ